MSFKGKVRAKEFPQELEWLNTAQPLALSELYGKIVLLDFWTYCCIIGMHVLPDLKKLEEKYPDELVVIGVHAAKFTNEKETANIRQAILRYDITHPVVNDLDGLVRRQYGVRAWPSFVLIDPEGKIVGRQSGERIYELFDRYIDGLVREFAWRGQLDRVPLELQREQGAAALFSFPGKLAVDPQGQHLYISDSNHHRIAAVDLARGRVAEKVGCGAAGLEDGDYAAARFNKPQGIALDGETLYVADTENHAVREIDLEARQVTTLIGTGRRRSGAVPRAPANRWRSIRPGICWFTTAASTSPWPVCISCGVSIWKAAKLDPMPARNAKTVSTVPYCRQRWPSPAALPQTARNSTLPTAKSVLFAAPTWIRRAGSRPWWARGFLSLATKTAMGGALSYSIPWACSTATAWSMWPIPTIIKSRN